MHRNVTLVGCIVLILFSGVVQAQTGFSIRAAAADPVPGWQSMESPDGSRTVWVAPTASLTAADMQRAQASTGTDGRTAVGIVFTDAGARKMRDLSAAQINKLIALVLDGKVIWSPVVRSEIGREASITGNGPNGVPPEVVERILASVNQK